MPPKRNCTKGGSTSSTALRRGECVFWVMTQGVPCRRWNLTGSPRESSLSLGPGLRSAATARVQAYASFGVPTPAWTAMGGGAAELNSCAVPMCLHGEGNAPRRKGRLSDDCRYRRCRRAKATPDPDFRQRSKAKARRSSANSMTTSTDHGRYSGGMGAAAGVVLRTSSRDIGCDACVVSGRDFSVLEHCTRTALTWALGEQASCRCPNEGRFRRSLTYTTGPTTVVARAVHLRVSH